MPPIAATAPIIARDCNARKIEAPDDRQKVLGTGKPLHTRLLFMLRCILYTATIIFLTPRSNERHISNEY